MWLGVGRITLSFSFEEGLATLFFERVQAPRNNNRAAAQNFIMMALVG
jgi:hypothetical protein